MAKMSFKLSTGNEVLIGLNINNMWTVSCWDNDYNLIWEKSFDNENEARRYFDHIEVEG